MVAACFSCHYFQQGHKWGFKPPKHGMLTQDQYYPLAVVPPSQGGPSLLVLYLKTGGQTEAPCLLDCPCFPSLGNLSRPSWEKQDPLPPSDLLLSAITYCHWEATVPGAQPHPPENAWRPSGGAHSAHDWWQLCGSRTPCRHFSGQGETLAALAVEGEKDRSGACLVCLRALAGALNNWVQAQMRGREASGDAVLQQPTSVIPAASRRFRRLPPTRLYRAPKTRVLQETPPLTFGVEPLLWKWVPRALSVGVLGCE